MELLEDARNLILIMFGFGLVVMWHELGHFLAARWAGVRVHTFAIGFGQALLSYRKGYGFQTGSSEQRYTKMVADRADAGEGEPEGVSSTEYRLNWIPLGGYVKMLGQEDLDPAARSEAPDSYNTKPVWKRMVIISAGVVMNVILGAVLFVAVYMHGKQELPAVVGDVAPLSPAAEVGIEPGSVIESIDGRAVSTMQEIMVAEAMSRRSETIEYAVRDVLTGERRTVSLEPEPGERRLRASGIQPPASNEIYEPTRASGLEVLATLLERLGLGEVQPGSALVEIAGTPIEAITVEDDEVMLFEPARRVLAASADGRARAVFSAPGEQPTQVEAELVAEPGLMPARAEAGGRPLMFGHVLGLSPMLRIGAVSEEIENPVVRKGDVVVRANGRWFPSHAQAVAAIRASAGTTMSLGVLRDGELVDLAPKVSAEGRIGFTAEHAFDSSFIAHNAELLRDADVGLLDLPEGNLSVRTLDGVPIDSFRDLWRELRSAGMAGRGEVTVGFDRLDETLAPIGAREVVWTLDDERLAALADLEWDASPIALVFAPAEFIVRAGNPAEAVQMGLGRTKRWLVLTGLTLVRLAEGTVEPQSLRGPVGIAHIGSMVAREGVFELMFLLALLSVNLAVINFLPLPILDGGQFVMLCYEGVSGRPVPVNVQGGLTLAGLVLIAGIFLFVTFNDIQRLFTGGL